MARASLGMLALVALSACGRVEHEPLEATTVGGAGTGGASTGGTDSSGPAGSGGVSQLQLAVAECQHYCETLDYRLPQALCEDWNRPEWEPPFCRTSAITETSCAEYCSKVYEPLTPECAAQLQPVIRCVAPTYTGIVLLPPSSCWLSDCRAQLFSMTSACYGLKERLAAARATWQASKVVDYQLTYDRSDDVTVRVRVKAGSDPVVSPADAFAWTVPKLFDEVERMLREPGVTPSVSYDVNLGYVVALAREEGCAQASAQVTGIEVAPLR